jgi:hypothetical protein
LPIYPITIGGNQKNFLQTLIAKNGKASKLLALYVSTLNL